MKARVFVHREFPIGEVDAGIFGSFVEHLGRCVYTGLYEPGHPTADENGFRQDVLSLVRELGATIVRYPGGNFVSGFDWHDSIGPKESRPVRQDYAWKAMEPNAFGLDEFLKWCRLAGVEPMYAVNLGTGTPKSAQEIVEYCNFAGRSALSDMRRKNGSEKPYGIRTWCLGNEMDGPWQIGQKTAEEYGRIARETAKLMKFVDPTIRLCVCGSCTRNVETYGDWDFHVLREAYDYVDFLSIHSYFENRAHNLPNFLSAPAVLDKQICDAVALCDAAKAACKSKRRMMVALDEWNVWYRAGAEEHPETEWQVARPVLEEVYDMADVLVTGGCLLTLLAHVDRVKMANLAQLVNVIAPIMTQSGGKAWRQTIFHPFALTSRFGRGTSLRVSVDSPCYEDTGEIRGEVPFLQSAVVYHADTQEISVFAINRSLDEAMELTAEFGGFAVERIIDAIEIHNDDPGAVNTVEGDKVAPMQIPQERRSLQGDSLQATLQPLSWNLFRLKVAAQ